MARRLTAAFTAVIAAQAAQSVEEYAFHLNDRLALTRFVSLQFSSDPARGFAIANTLIVLAGICCAFIVRRSGPAGRAAPRRDRRIFDHAARRDAAVIRRR
jgi:hypothetical protein